MGNILGAVLGGVDRYATSQLVARRMRSVMGTRTAVFFVNGEDPNTFSDGALASAIATLSRRGCFVRRVQPRIASDRAVG